MRKVIFGIRQSRLAQAQLDEFISRLNNMGIGIDYEVRKIKTSGDRDSRTPLESLGQGIFIKELERKLISRDIDCAVHSLKDMPVEVNKKTALACFLPRADARDCLVFNKHMAIDEIGLRRIAAGSPRRQAFIHECFPHVKTLPVRGNVDTRLEKLDSGEFDAVVLAACGLKRLGLERRISRYLDYRTFVPDAGQGTICAQIRYDDDALMRMLQAATCRATTTAVNAERKILREFGIGCRTPFGIYARFEDKDFVITAKMYQEKNGMMINCTQRGAAAFPDNVVKAFVDSFKQELNRNAH